MLVDGEDEETALGRAVEIAAEYEDEFETDAGDIGHDPLRGDRGDQGARRSAGGRHGGLARVHGAAPASRPMPTASRCRPCARWRWPFLAPTTSERAGAPMRLPRGRVRSSSRSIPSESTASRLRGLRMAGGNRIGRGVAGLAGGARRPAARSSSLGFAFRNRVGVGAGFDKDAVALRGWAALGLGFVEVGTVTPAGAGRQSPAAPFPAVRRTRRSSTGWASTTPGPRRSRAT